MTTPYDFEDLPCPSPYSIDSALYQLAAVMDYVRRDDHPNGLHPASLLIDLKRIEAALREDGVRESGPLPAPFDEVREMVGRLIRLADRSIERKQCGDCKLDLMCMRWGLYIVAELLEPKNKKEKEVEE